MAFCAKKFHEEEALKLGMIDGIVTDLSSVIQKAQELAVFSKNR